MDVQDPASLEKIRQQFDLAPYPRVPLEESPKENLNLLYTHNLVTSYYLRHQTVIDPKETVILDAGCGSGYKSLILAEANPGAHIIGIDISEQSVNLSRQRLSYHGFDNVEFFALSIYDLPQLGLTFDYINCDETLYLLPDPLNALNVMRAVLKPKGIIRSNLHSIYQRAKYYRAQELFKLMGLMDDNPDEFAMDVVIETMRSLKDTVALKAETWHPIYEQPGGKEGTLVDYLLVGDKGFTIPDLFELLEAAQLEFVQMLNWRMWEVEDLFQDPENLPSFWGMSLLGASVQERLRMYELMNPKSRLLDFWCALPDSVAPWQPVELWSDVEWQQATVTLHPQLKNERVRDELIRSIQGGQSFQISLFIDLPTLHPVLLDNTLSAALLPLWDEPQPFTNLVARYLAIRPIDPISLVPVTEAIAFDRIKTLLNQLDAFLYVLLEQKPHHLEQS